MSAPKWVLLRRGDVRALCVVREGDVVWLVVVDDGGDGRPLIQASLDPAEAEELLRAIRECARE